MVEIKAFQRKLFSKKLFVCISSFFILFIIVVITLVRAPHSETQQQLSQQQQQLSQQLSTIEARLNDLTTQINQSKSVNPAEMETLSQQLHTIQNSLTTIDRQSDFKNLQLAFNNSQHDIVEKLQSLQKNLQQLKQRISPQGYLPSSSLPFKVISIDIWNGEPQATIMLDGNATLMAKQDIYSGWTLADISFDPAYAIFINDRQQFVKVDF